MRDETAQEYGIAIWARQGLVVSYQTKWSVFVLLLIGWDGRKATKSRGQQRSACFRLQGSPSVGRL